MNFIWILENYVNAECFAAAVKVAQLWFGAKTDYVLLKAFLNAVSYRELFVLPYAAAVVRSDFQLMHYNVRSHRAMAEVLLWPAQSPD